MNPQTNVAGHVPAQSDFRKQSPASTVPTSKARLVTGRIITGLVVAFLTFDFIMKLVGSSLSVDATVALGYEAGHVFGIGLLLLICTVLYVIPRTSVLGAILLTGYLGGATATHVRVNQPFFFPVVFGVLVWLGLYLRDSRLRMLLPLGS